MAVPPASAAVGEPRIFGAVNGPTRIIIRATGDCWLQVRDPDDTLVAQRTLHKDDIYRVPEEPGLIMRTGNASVLEITVDGKAVHPIGGTVRHVLLDPQRLLAGTATNE
jgi:cytoskeleton protein RodZ